MILRRCSIQYRLSVLGTYLGAFTGARVSEISQLSSVDIQQDDSGLWFIRIAPSLDDDDLSVGESLKNEESRSIIPAHQN